MKKNKVSIRDIAKLTNTSITTVSFVLNGKGRISKEITKKILRVAKANGYEPNRMAVGLRTGTSKIIGFIVETVGGPFFGAIAKVIEEVAEKAGYSVIYCSTNNNLQKAKSMIKMLSQQMVDGYIISPVKGLEEDIKSLIDNEKPVVLIDGYFPELNVPHVLVDNYKSVYSAIQFLINSRYSKIAFITVDLGLIQLEDRMSGYNHALIANKITPDERLVLKIPFLTEKSAAVDLIKDFLLKNSQLDAVFFSTNYIGVIGLQSINQLGIKIPGDLAVISFDDDEIFSLYQTGVTTIQQPTYKIAKSAIDILLSQMRRDKIEITNLNLKIPSKLIKRGSTSKMNIIAPESLKLIS